MSKQSATAAKAANTGAERAEEDTVAYDVRDGIAWVKFNRPEKRNCMSPKLNRQMMRVLEALEFRDDVGVLVLTRERSQGPGRCASVAAGILWLVACASLVPETDDRHGQWLVFRRRLWSALCL